MNDEDADSDDMFALLPPASSLPLVTRRNQRIDFDTLVKIDPDNLSAAFTNQASWAGFFNFNSALSSARVERQVRKIKEMEGELYLHYKSSATSKKMTVEEVKAAVYSDPKLKACHDELFALRKEQAAWDAAKWAWGDRRDMLMQLGADHRADKKNF